jgi:diguanylate cyclase (GGDEF)-like protein
MAMRASPDSAADARLDDDARQRHWAAKNIGGYLLLAGAVLVDGIAAFSYARSAAPPKPDTRPLDFILTVPPLILGIFLITRRKPVPTWLLNVAPSFAAILICVPTAVDKQPGPLGPVLLTWPVVFAAFLLSVRVAWATMGVVAASFAVLASSSRGVDGLVLWLEVTAGITVVCLMVIGLRRQGDRLRADLAELARTDSLTGLANRRGFDEALRREHAQHLRDGKPLSLLAVDIDHFKQVNDAWGHPTGDIVLASLGRFLASRARASDMIGRQGGEEFALLLPDCSAAQALARGQELCDAVRADSKTWEHAITISVGVATLPRDASTPRGLQEAADAALYTAKQSGRDRVVGAGSAMR